MPQRRMSDSERPDIFALSEPPLGRPRLKRLRLALILFGLSLLALVSTAFGMMMAVASDLPELENRKEFNKAQNSLLTDVHNRYLATLADQGRIIIPASSIAPIMQHAIIAVEDRRFYQNDGVDLRGTGRALWQDVTSGKAVQGGSTITQQFVKNATQAQNRRTVLEKVREAALAYHLTRKWPKKKILTEYLNSIYFGNGAYGIESAARTYFGQTDEHFGCGKPERRCAHELKPYEAALLAGMVASPSAFDPVANPAAAKRRRNLVLTKMLEQGYMTRGEYLASTAAEVPTADLISPPTTQTATRSTGYFATWVRQQVVERYGARTALEGGLRVQTTLDLGVQRAAEDAVKHYLGDPPHGPQAALVAIDNDSGEIRAMVGGTDYAQAPFNLATQGQRQPGSAFKPFVLATAIRRGISPSSTWTSKRMVIHVPHSIEKFTVNNYDGNYSGVSTLARATTFSDNSVFAQVGIKAGTKHIARTAAQMGIRTPVSSNYAITLGGLRHGVTPLDLAHAYETFATGGVLVSGSLGARKRGPVGIRRVMLRDSGRVRHKNVRRLRRVLPRGVAEKTVDILRTVINDGTGKLAGIQGVPAWGKTGTTENYGDAWFVGATPKLTVAVWVGYPNGLKPMTTEYNGDPVAGGTFPALIWHDFMVAVLEADKQRLERRCQADREKLAGAPDAPPPTSCIKAGIEPDPATQATGDGDAATPDTTTTPADGVTTGDAPADGNTDTLTPETDGATPATPPASPPAAPPGSAPAPAPEAPAPPDSGGATPSGGEPPATP
ncbi:MAG: penicillin-binding protein [Solirubrobacteraceae bacterium]|nr:penicillin-binding protein [Solirubrobacteraceae bacterium]